jgi:hypothetical protein
VTTIEGELFVLGGRVAGVNLVEVAFAGHRARWRPGVSPASTRSRSGSQGH